VALVHIITKLSTIETKILISKRFDDKNILGLGLGKQILKILLEIVVTNFDTSKLLTESKKCIL